MAIVNKRGRIRKMKAIDIEIAVAKHIGIRTHLIVPNISWGMYLHECDLLVLTPAGYAWEIEIKVTKADLINDKKKHHKHRASKIKYLYFAIPSYLEQHIEHIPEKAGIIVVYLTPDNQTYCRTKRKPKASGDYKFSEKQRLKMASLGCMRIWGLKEKVRNAQREVKQIKNNAQVSF